MCITWRSCQSSRKVGNYQLHVKMEGIFCFKKVGNIEVSKKMTFYCLASRDHHKQKWLVVSAEKSDSVFAKVPAGVKHSCICWWCFNLPILHVSLAGSTDVGPLGSKRAFLGYPHCRKSLALKTGKTYLIMGTSKDIRRETQNNVPTWVCPLTYRPLSEEHGVFIEDDRVWRQREARGSMRKSQVPTGLVSMSMLPLFSL